MRCEQVRSVLSDYLEESLEIAVRRSVATHLQECKPCTYEAKTMAQFLTLMHTIPYREPSLDIWGELEPKIEATRQEMQLSTAERLRLQAGRFLNNVSVGAILFTHALAVNTANRLQKYVQHDPLSVMEEAGR